MVMLQKYFSFTNFTTAIIKKRVIFALCLVLLLGGSGCDGIFRDPDTCIVVPVAFRIDIPSLSSTRSSRSSQFLNYPYSQGASWCEASNQGNWTSVSSIENGVSLRDKYGMKVRYYFMAVSPIRSGCEPTVTLEGTQVDIIDASSPGNIYAVPVITANLFIPNERALESGDQIIFEFELVEKCGSGLLNHTAGAYSRDKYFGRAVINLKNMYSTFRGPQPNYQVPMRYRESLVSYNNSNCTSFSIEQRP